MSSDHMGVLQRPNDRGFRLEFGDLAGRVDADPIYRRAMGLSWQRSHLSEAKKRNLFLILRDYIGSLDCQNVIEFGSYKGGTAIFMAAILQEVHPEARVYALDTFTGMPPVDKSVDFHSAGDFSDSTFEEVQRAVDEAGLNNVALVKGLFADTFPTLVQQGLKFGLAHIDGDIYSAVKYSQDAVWPQMTNGGYVVYDDPLMSSCPGAMRAVEELIIERRIHSEQAYPHFVFRTGNVTP